MSYTAIWRFTKLAIALSVMLPAAQAQSLEPSWRSFSTSDGLASNRITAIAEASDGTLWVGTSAGLRYFFGQRFAIDTAAPADVGKATVQALLETSDKALWVATHAGLHRRRADGSWDEHLEREAGLETPDISALLQKKDGTLWVGARDGLARWDGDTWQLLDVDGQAPRVNALAEDAEGRLWVAEPTRVLVLQADQLVKSIGAEEGLPRGAELKALLRDSRDQTWLATANGLVEFAGVDVARILARGEGLGNGEIWALAEGSNGLWVGTGSGLAQLADGSAQRVLTRADGLAGDTVLALWQDREGNLWAGTDQGLTRLPVARWAVDADPLLGSASIQAVLPGQPGGDYLAIAAGVVHRSPDGKWSPIPCEAPVQATFALAGDNSGQVWLGSDAGLLRLEGSRFVPDARVPLSSTVSALLADERSGLWAGTDRGLYFLAEDKVRRFDDAGGGPGSDIVLALWQTQGGDVWLGTLNRGAHRLRQGAWLTVTQQSTHGGLVDDIVLAGLEDSHGDLWFGTSAGLSHLRAGADPTVQASWQSFVEPDLAGNRVNALWEDSLRPGHIWVATDRGLSLIVDGEASVFTRTDGLSGEWVNALGQDPAGTLWIGTGSGLTYHHDAELAPQLVLYDPLVDNRACDARCRAVCRPYDSNTALFQFQGSDLGDIEGLRYAYTLQRSGAMEPELPGLLRATDYTVDLHPGTTYTFTIAAVDRDFNASPAQSAVLCVAAATRWESFLELLRAKPWLGWLLLGCFLVVAAGLVAGALVGYRAYRRSERYPYYDVRIAFSAAAEPGHAAVQVDAKQLRSESGQRPVRRPILSAFGKIRPPQGQPSRQGDIDCRPIEEIEQNLEFMAANPVSERRLLHIGDMLYDMAFADSAIGAQMQRIGLGRRRVRLRFCFDGQRKLAGLPWELLHDPRLGFLGRRADTALVRFEKPAQALERRPLQQRLRALVVMAVPRDKPELELQLARQKARLDRSLGAIADLDYLFGAHAAGLVGVEIDAQDNDKDLPYRLAKRLDEGWDILHFVGHAGLDLVPLPDSQPEIVLYCEDEAGDYLPLGANQLGTMLEGLSGDAKVPKLVLLNACDTASMASPLVRTLLDCGVEAVVGMQWPVMEEAAQVFADQFYSTLGQNYQVDHAVGKARSQIPGQGRRDWAAPVLVMQVENGLIFERV